jgi:hypothetical protein
MQFGIETAYVTVPPERDLVWEKFLVGKELVLPAEVADLGTVSGVDFRRSCIRM